MAVNAITIEDILEPLNAEEKAEILLPDFKVPLEYYIEGYNTNPQTTEAARDKAVIKIRTIAKKRIALKNEIKKNPEILKSRDDPLVIIGLHRSGTTMLHRLLASDPQFISPMQWEMMEPVPAGRPKDWRECDRYLKTKKDLEHNTYESQGGTLDSIHLYELEKPEECMVLLMDYFLELPEAQFIKTMEKWKNFVYHCPRDHVKKAYEYYKTCLQCIAYQSQDKKMLVKSGMHLLFMDVYKEVFPNAKYILICRDAKEIIPSLASLASKHGQSEGFTDDEMGKRMLEYFGLVTSEAAKFAQSTPEENHITLGYRDLIKDPLASAKKIYSHFKLKLPLNTIEIMQRHIEENQQHKHGKHKYGIEEFGITEEDIENNNKDYLEFLKERPEMSV